MGRVKTIAEVLAGIPYASDAPASTRVGGIAYSSRDVHEGDLFFCVVGFKADGHDYASDAVTRGASALVCERRLPLDVPQFVVDDSRFALALASDNLFDHPSRRLGLVGVTGTNGKTTTAYLVERMLSAQGRTT
ncbi:MAG: Mur ligase domain-containing protein, partial [Coriobacteriales bacterium]